MPDRPSPSPRPAAARAISRRALVGAGVSVAAFAALPGAARQAPGYPAAEAASPAGAGSPVVPAFPAQDPALVRGVVGSSHGNLARVRELVEAQPELAKAAWDWGFGDWESALGAASHTGNREIAELLMAHGARPDLFTFTMLGNLAAVRAIVEGTPGIQSRLGPHGITLLAHARFGGEPAAPVVAYLEKLGGADEGYANLPLSADEQQAYAGTYVFGPGPEDRFDVAVDPRGFLTVQRGPDGTPRVILNQGEHEFHPAGAPSARLRFSFAEGAAGRPAALTLHNPDLVVEARRVS